MESPASARQLPVILALGTTQTLAWASSYYLPAILADPIARDLGISSNWFFAAFSAALVISGLLGPRVGRQIDIVGGRQVLSISNVTFAIGLAMLGGSHSLWMLAIAWLLLGIGMGLGLYDAAFGALGRIYGDKARRAITGITLLAGFASTIGWPLTAWGLESIGWRNTCFAWAAAHVIIGLPLNVFFLPTVKRVTTTTTEAVKPHIPIDRTMALLAFAFAAAWAVTGAMAAHLPRILESTGATTVQAIAAGAFIGPAQVFARVMEVSVLSRLHPFTTTRLACITHPLDHRGGFWWWCCERICGLPWSGQRHSHDRSRHLATRHLRATELRLSTRPAGSSRPHRAGTGPARLQPLDRCSGQPRAAGLICPEYPGVAGS